MPIKHFSHAATCAIGCFFDRSTFFTDTRSVEIIVKKVFLELLQPYAIVGVHEEQRGGHGSTIGSDIISPLGEGLTD